MSTLRSAKAVFIDIERFVERSVTHVTRDINKLAKQKTPVRTGRARRGWTIRDKYKRGRTIILQNLVPYIGVLDSRKKIIKPSADRAVYIAR